MIQSAIQRAGLGADFGLSHRGDLPFGQTVGRSSPRASHSWPHRHRHPSSLTIPISLSFAIVRYLSYLLIIYTSGIDKYPRMDILSVYTNEGYPDVRTTTAGTRNSGEFQHHQARSRHVRAPLAARQGTLCRDDLERGQVLPLPRFRVAPTALQTRVRRAIRPL